jgi:hypothetical protein
MTVSKTDFSKREDIVSFVVITLMLVAVAAMVKKVDHDRQRQTIPASDLRGMEPRALSSSRRTRYTNTAET